MNLINYIECSAYYKLIRDCFLIYFYFISLFVTFLHTEWIAVKKAQNINKVIKQFKFKIYSSVLRVGLLR